MKLTLNNTNASLRDLLENEGFVFPCNGKGLCGRCRIIAPTLPITDKDRTFIPIDDLKKGVRLACDKVVSGEVEIDCLLAKRTESVKKVGEGDAYVVFEEERSLVGLIADGEIVEELVLPPVNVDFRALRSFAQHETIELYEKYGLAKSTVMLLTGTPQKITECTGIIEEYDYVNTVEAHLFDMPSEEVCLLPKPTALIGGDLLLETLGRAEGTLVVKGSYFVYIGDTTLYCARVIPNLNNPETYVATLAYFIKKYNPENAVYVGANVIAAQAGLKSVESVVSENVVNVLTSNRQKAKLERLAKKVVEIPLADDEDWQNLLTEITK
ncbi:MAG: hypothetical protein J6R35_03735 [Clostridia bacterium]|nr:hypothetical protein [Clostridia bacterium]